jgi:epoxyqueuosine reductase
MKRDWQRRARPAELLPGAKSVIALAASYYAGDSLVDYSPSEEGRKRKQPGRIARYAWGKDYHKVLDKRLGSLVRYLQALAPDARCKTYVDTGPLLERAIAQRSGLGFIGKNTMLITRGLGSWVFLASIVTTLKLPADGPDTRSCGSCRLCIDACPTEALAEPYHLDARRCISYLTIEAKSPIPESFQSPVGTWLFGCDICQEVCPHNTRIPVTPVPEFQPAAGAGPALNPDDILAMNDSQFEARFAGTPLKRAKRSGLQRNAAVVQHNTRSK